MGAIRFRAFDDAAPALAELRDLGLALVCVSNWDVSLPDVLVRCGLDGALDGVVTSAQAGARKPDPGDLRARPAARRLLPRRGPLRGRHPDEDVQGGRAAGIPTLLIDRDGGADIDSLDAIRHHLTE